jgi:2-polyprenyl-6-methoxyphenol hydroxylase-like FAD-dependent oxidoreductase
MGANTALRDAADLARRISLAGGVDGVDQAVIGDYEASLREFARTAIEQSWQGGMKSFGLKPIEQCQRIAL